MINCFTKCAAQLTEAERQELFDFQTQFEYEPFTTDLGPDGNFLYRTFNAADLPKCFFDKFQSLFDIEKRLVFLKNNGAVIRHQDVRRHCSITIPLNITSTATLFWNDATETVPIAELLHNGEAYLQNNQVFHSVLPSNETRYFLQLTFKEHTYEQIRDILNA
jgi:hypothetical protein